MTARTDQVERLWPTDGPHTPESARDAARAWAHLGRYLAYATQSRTAIGSPVDVYDVVGSLVGGLPSLAQALRQIGGRLGQAATDPGLRVDTLGPATDPADVALTASEAAEDAADALWAVLTRLQACQSATGRLYHHGGDQP